MKKKIVKKIVCLFGVCVLLSTSSQSVSASVSSDSFRITNETTLGDVMRYTDPINYYSYSKEDRNRYNEINFKEMESKKTTTVTNSNNTMENQNIMTAAVVLEDLLAAGLSSSVESNSKGNLSYSATLEVTHVCPSLYLSGIAYDKNGTVVSDMGNRRYYKKKVTLANLAYHLTSGAKYHVTFYGTFTAPAGFYPEQGVVSSTKYVTVK